MIRTLKSKTLVAALLGLGLAMTACDKGTSPEDPTTSAGKVNPSEPAALGDKSSDAYSTKTVYFAFDSSVIDSSNQAKLTEFSEHLKKSPEKTIQIEGHCDERGTHQYNLALGERRAAAVKHFLVNLGVTEGQLTTISYGEERPVAQGHSEEAWHLNRRAEFVSAH